MEKAQQKVRQVMEETGVKGNTSFLGEGAWHQAFLLKTADQKLVIRFPKEIAYGEKIEYNEKELLAEYAGQKRFYKHSNNVLPGIAPEYFEFKVSPSLTYTIESFVGDKIDLNNIAVADAIEIGRQYGHFFKKMNETKHGLNGFGYLTWNENTNDVEGQFQSNVSEFMKEENEEILNDDLPYLFQSGFAIKKELIQDKVVECLSTRTISSEDVAFTNQDTSPENILLRENKIHAIDPFPILYYGHAFAGNFLNNYDTLFLALHDSPRYAKHHFYKTIPELKAILHGFCEQYASADQVVQKLVNREQFLQLLNTTIIHIQLASDRLTISKQMRYGSKQQITKRIPNFIKKLEDFQV